MTEPDPSHNDHPAGTAGRMRAIAAGLHAAGLDAELHQTRGVLDITATMPHPGSTDVTVDEDSYIQISWWNDPDATPNEVVATITRALAAIASP